MAGETVEKWRKVWERDDETEAPLTAPWEALSWGRERTAGSGDSVASGDVASAGERRRVNCGV